MATIKATLWSNFSKKIRQRNASHSGFVRCVSCGKTEHWTDTDCGHFIENTERSKGFGGNKLWFDPRNFGAQCIKCNRFNAAEAKRQWTVSFLEKHGKELYEELLSLHRTPKKWTREEIEEIINSIEV